MPRIVIDTNVLVSAILNRAGAPAQVLEQVFAGVCEPVVSDAILDEYRRVLLHPRLGLPAPTVERMLRYLRHFVLPLPPALPPQQCTDPDDTKFLAAAIAGGASVLVTGNQRHFPERVPSLRILAPAALLALLREMHGKDI